MPSSNSREDGSKTPTATIKIAAKESSQRAAVGQADPGPGDPNAEPSQAPELVNIPAPPTPSELVVKSSNSRVIKTINDPVSLRKNSNLSASVKQIVNDSMGSAANDAASPGGAPRESTSSKALSSAPPAGPSQHHSGSRSGSGAPAGAGGSGSARAARSPAGSTGRFSVKSTGSAGSSASGINPGRTASQAMAVSPGGNVQDEIVEGEGEIEHPPESPSPGASGAAGSSAGGGIDTAPASSGGGASKMSPKTSGSRAKSSAGASAGVEPSGSRGPKSPGTSDAASDTESLADGGKKKKVTKFRYHKRITVRTHGKTSPSQIMDKVNKKDHKQGITPSTIEDMDPQELMKRAGIKGNKNSHWRVRLRQTKRLTKNGKTVTQTKVAYRDSEGNKRVKTVLGPNCKKCGKKLEECKCDD